MTPMAVFIRTLSRTSAIFLGTAMIFLHPPLDWTPRRAAVSATQSPAQSALDGLVVLLADKEVNVRRVAAYALARTASVRELPALVRALDDPDPIVRRQAGLAIRRVRGTR